MVFFARSVIISLSYLLLPISANAAPLCEYAAFSVPVIHKNILVALEGLGFALAPAAYFSVSNPNLIYKPDRAQIDQEFLVLSGGKLYAKLSVKQNLVEATSELRITGSSGDFLVSATSTTLPCSGGWCRKTQLLTARDSVSGSVDNTAGLSITQEPSYGMRYLVYDERVGATSWRTQFDDRYEWILSVLTDSSQSMPLEAFTPMQRFIFAVSSKPAVTPFLNDIEVSVASDGHFVVRGRVTHAAYNGIVDAALESGFYDIEPLLVIDSAAGAEWFADRSVIYPCMGYR